MLSFTTILSVPTVCDVNSPELAVLLIRYPSRQFQHRLFLHIVSDVVGAMRAGVLLVGEAMAAGQTQNRPGAGHRRRAGSTV